jgi:hypothetical protein
MKKNWLPLLLGVMMMTAFHLYSYGQDKKDYSYLRSCFSATGIDTAQMEIDGFGEVFVLDYNSDTLEETGLMVFTVPPKKQDKTLSKLAMTATQFHVKLWKNNSNVVAKNEIQLEGASMVDLRLHMLIENIYLQVITIAEGDKIYQVSCFRDTNETAFFDAMVNKLKEKKCL